MTPNNLVLFQKAVAAAPANFGPPVGFSWRIKQAWIFIHAGAGVGDRSGTWVVAPGTLNGQDGGVGLVATGTITGSGGAAMGPSGASGLGVVLSALQPLPMLGHGDSLQLSLTLLAGDTADWYLEVEEEVDGL